MFANVRVRMPIYWTGHDIHRPSLTLLMKTSRNELDSVALAGLYRMILGSQSSYVNNQVKSNETALFL